MDLIRLEGQDRRLSDEVPRLRCERVRNRGDAAGAGPGDLHGRRKTFERGKV